MPFVQILFILLIHVHSPCAVRVRVQCARPELDPEPVEWVDGFARDDGC